MAHNVSRAAYSDLVDRLNRFPQGAPPSDLLFAILKMLFSEQEAGLVALLPIRPFTAQKAADIWRLPVLEAQKTLDALASRAILVDTTGPDGAQRYVLPPPMAGFFEFSMMRLRGDLDQKVLAELLYQYLNVEEEFVRTLFTTGETQLGRAFVQEAALAPDNALYVLDYERASEVIRSATTRGVGVCYCRHKMHHVDRACDAPLDICMTFGTTARSLVIHDYAREVDAVEALDLLQQAQERNLVQFGENVRSGVNFICNCCGCCCEAMIVGRKFAFLNPIHTTNFLPAIADAQCNGCGKCVNVCPVEALMLVSANDPHRPKLRRARLDADRCLGCGVCVRSCKWDAITLEQRPQRVLTPLNTAHRTVLMAIERGLLPELIFDNRALFSHRALAAIFGVILQLPPAKQALASNQLRSRYLERLISLGARR